MQLEYKVLNGQTIEDVAVLTYGSIDFVSQLITDNNLTFDSDITGLTLIWDNTLTNTIPSSINVNNTIIESDLSSVIGQYGQSFYDVAIHTQATIENVIQLAIDNNISINNLNDIKGLEITYSKSNIKNFAIYNFISNLNTGVSSGLLTTGKGSFNDSFNISFN